MTTGFFGRCLAASVFLVACGPAAARTADRPSVATASREARAEVMRARVKNDVLTLELRFEATTEPFGGEIVYAALDRGAVWIESDGGRWPLVDGSTAAPAELRLNFSYDLSKTPRVGAWTGRFVAPPGDVKRITLHLPNLPPIENIEVSR